MRKPDRKFWNRVRTAGERLLALDYDGTLAPFRVDRMAARPRSDILPVLSSIEKQGVTRLVIISGRPLYELEELIGALSNRLILIGAHGWESRVPGGDLFRHAPPEETRDSLDAAYDMAVGYWGKRPPLLPEMAERVERKNAGVAVHVRGMPPEKAEEWLASVRVLWGTLESPFLDIREFNGGIELRALSRDKGLAIREQLESFPSTELIVYLGDDVTDEDVFRVLKGLDIGVGIKVGGSDETSADYRVRDVDAVLEFLTEWERMAGGSLQR